MIWFIYCDLGSKSPKSAGNTEAHGGAQYEIPAKQHVTEFYTDDIQHNVSSSNYTDLKRREHRDPWRGALRSTSLNYLSFS